MKPVLNTFDLKNFKFENTIFKFDSLLILLFSLVHFVPAFEALDPIGAQWLYISIIDLISIIYIILNWIKYSPLCEKLINNLVFIFFLLFVTWASLSYFYAFNNVETLVCLARMLATFISTILITLLILKNHQLVILALFILAITLVFDSFNILNNFIANSDKIKLDPLIITLRGLNGNKNVMAASLVIRLPLLFYFLFEYKNNIVKTIFSLCILITTATIFILNTRSTYVSLVIFIILQLTYIIYVHFKNRISIIKETLFFITPIILALLLSNNLINHTNDLPINKETTNGYGTVTDRFKTIQFTDEGSSARLRLWREAISYSLNHPIIGCGYGNWKLLSIPYEKAFANEADVPYHSHNDFLEIATETGIIGLLLFIGIFVASIYLFIKAIIQKNQEIIFFIILLSLLGYMVDALLNFPTERSTIQSLFSFIIAIIISLNILKNNTNIARQNKKTATFLVPIFILFSIIFTSFINYKTFTWLKLQNKLFYDVMGKTEPKIPTDQIEDQFPDIPNLTYSTIPSNGILARYYIRDKRYNEALSLIESIKNVNPFIGYYGFLKTDCFFNMGNIDSAFFYAKQCFYERPRSLSYYNNLVNLASDRKISDTSEIKKAFKIFTSYRNESAAWTSYLKCLMNTNKVSGTEIKSILDSANKLFPKDSSFSVFKIVPVQKMNYDSLFKLAITKFSAKAYNEAIYEFKKLISYKPDDYANYENIGLCYFSNNQYKEAIIYFDKAINFPNNPTGKSAFLRGIALINTGNKKEGCNSFELAKQRKYPDSDTYLKNNCKF